MMNLRPASEQSSRWPTGTRNVRRTVAILRAVAKYQSKGAPLSKIARTVGLPISTVKRILTALTLDDFVSLSDDSKQYYIGYGLYDITKESFPLNFLDQYRDVIDTIARQTGDTVYLNMRSGLEQLCIGVAEGNFSIRISYGVGSRSLLGLLAGGVAILASLPRKEIDYILSKNAPRYIEYGVTAQEIWNHIEEYRKMGYVRYESRVIAGLVGVAVVIGSEPKKTIASIVVSSTAQRMPPERCEQIQKLIKRQINAGRIGTAKQPLRVD